MICQNDPNLKQLLTEAQNLKKKLAQEQVGKLHLFINVQAARSRVEAEYQAILQSQVIHYSYLTFQSLPPPLDPTAASALPELPAELPPPPAPVVASQSGDLQAVLINPQGPDGSLLSAISNTKLKAAKAIRLVLALTLARIHIMRKRSC